MTGNPKTSEHPISAIARASAVAVTLVCVAASGCGSNSEREIVGSWKPREVPSVEFGPTFNANRAKITFAKDGTWTASDSCNDLSGTYSLDEDGAFEGGAGGASAGVGCGGGSVPYDLLLSQTDRVTISDGGSAATFETSEEETLLVLDPA